MESIKRTIAKAASWQTLGVVSMTLIGYFYTGSVQEGGAIAVTGTVTGFLAYFLHERAWARVSWGRRRSNSLPRRDAGHHDQIDSDRF